MPTPFPNAEGNTECGVTRESHDDPARSETLSMPGSYLHRSWEVSTVPDGSKSGGAEKGNRNPAIDAVEKSDASVVPKKRPNKGEPAEDVEGRGAAKGNADESPACRTPSRESALTGYVPYRINYFIFNWITRSRQTRLVPRLCTKLLVKSYTKACWR